MSSCFRWLFLALVFTTTAHASSPVFNNVTGDQFDKIVKELSANFSYSSVTPASSLGSVWGLEFGPVVGYTKTPDILQLVQSADANTSLKDKFPHASILARVGVPLGLTAEVMFLPAYNKNGVKINQLGGAAMWTITDLFFADTLPFTWAVKGYLTKTTVKYTETFTPVNYGIPVTAGIEFSDSIYGIQTILSRKFFVFEPYLGLGLMKAKGALTVSGGAGQTIFSPAFSTSQTAESKQNSSQLLLGMDVRLLFLSLGAEYQRSFARNSYTARLSFRF